MGGMVTGWREPVNRVVVTNLIIGGLHGFSPQYE
jgi:hypothetical protein